MLGTTLERYADSGKLTTSSVVVVQVKHGKLTTNLVTFGWEYETI